MPAPGIITGRNLLAPEGFPNEVEGRFFSSIPAGTPKFALNRGPRRSEFTETMARLIIDVPPAQMAALMRSLPADTAAAAQTLLYAGNVTTLRDGNAQGAGFFDFMLTQATMQQVEREQAIDTLTDNTIIYYSGQSSPLLQCSGYLYNTYQDDQVVWFHLLYNDLLRGTQLARRGLVTRFRYDSFFLSGYMTNFVVTTIGDAKNYAQFSFTFRIKQIQISTPIIYNPTLTQSLLATNLFVDPSPPGADNATRHGVETGEIPLAPRAMPAASTQGNVDPRETARTESVPPREQQAAVDREITQQTNAALAQTPADPVAAQALDRAAAPIVSASGDVRQTMPASQSQIFQNFSMTSPTPEASPSDPLAQLDIEIERQLRTADTRGTVVVSPITGAPDRSSAYADTIARAQTTQLATATKPAEGPGPGTTPAYDADGEDLLDVYRAPPRLVAEFLRVRAEADATKLRSRQRSTT